MSEILLLKDMVIFLFLPSSENKTFDQIIFFTVLLFFFFVHSYF